MDLDILFNPESVAVIGASRQDWGGGGLIMQSITWNRYPGKVYPINPREKEIMGLPVYPSVEAVPGNVDVAFIALAAAAVPGVLRECRRKGVKFAVVHSSGFGELNEAGKKLEQEMTGIARDGGPRVIGANSMGVYSPRSSLNTVITYEAVQHEPGGVAFIGQSGWATENYVRLGLEQGLRFSKVVSIGNQCDLTIEDFFPYFASDSETRMVTGYLEDVKRPGEFLQVARKLSAKKPVILWKASRTPAGMRVAASHTG
ncbi:MAG: CoA-binding protein, partial [Dehalococcoidia bacterium]|nr:CoA-binding protein [Dehalococcoidia bacterium]